MQDLTLVGLTEDKTRLVLVSDSGEEYTLPADARLTAALRGDHARLGQLEIQMESALRPRDIQARIRAGESPEAVAQAAQTTVDRIMSFATPVLAERAHIADRAQRASVRRKGGEGPARLLGDAVAERLRTKNVDPDSVEWDAWRREDGRWRLVADFRDAGRPRHAEFTFDVQGRYVVPEDDEARALVGEATRKQPAPTRTQTSGRRPMPLPPEDELPLGDDAIELVTGPGPEAGPQPAEAEELTVDLTPAARRLRSAADLPVGGSSTGDADWIATQASERPHAPTPEAPAGSEKSAPEGEASGADADGRQPEAPARETAEQDTDDAASAAEAPKKGGRKGRRASVPSWDEIMFGGGRSD